MPHAQFPEFICSLENYKGQFNAFELRAGSCRVLFASFEAGTEIEPHSHDTENVGIVTKGELCLTQKGIEKRYGVGEWYHIDRHEIHSARFEQDSAEIEFWFIGEHE